MTVITVGLYAEQEGETKMDKIGDALSKPAEHLDFAARAAEIDKAAPRSDREHGGRPPFPMELVVRELVVQRYYNFSGEHAEFVDLRQSLPAPDRTAIWTYKKRLKKKAVTAARIFEAVSQQLDRLGYIARGGRIVDASIMPVPRQTLNKDEKTILRPDAMPAQWSPSMRRQECVQARWTRKHGKSSFDFTLSSSVDRRHKLVRREHVSTASENDTLHFERVFDASDTSRDICAHKGYVDEEREQSPARACLADKHPEQGADWDAAVRLPGAAQQAHCQGSRPRGACVRRSGTDGGKALLSIGLARATLHVNRKSATHNLRRLCSPMEVGLTPS